MFILMMICLAVSVVSGTIAVIQIGGILRGLYFLSSITFAAILIYILTSDICIG
jgi:hypothetical protein